MCLKLQLTLAATITTINVSCNYNHYSMDSCSSLLQSLRKSKNWYTTWSQIQNACPCQAQIKWWMLSSWLCYHMKLCDLQLPSKALTYFNATNVSIVVDTIQISKSVPMSFYFYSREHKVLHYQFFELN